MALLFSIPALLVIATLGFFYLRFKHRTFRAEVVIETLRIWREMVAERRQQYPDDHYSMSIPEEAGYMAMKGPLKLRQMVHRQAFSIVSDMQKYAFEEYTDNGRAISRRGEIYATNELQAAQKSRDPISSNEDFLISSS